MSASDLNLDLTYFDWPEVKRLVGLLGRGTEALPLRLWTYCGRVHCEDGRLSGYTAPEVESACGWWGESGRMVAAMLKVGFLRPLESQEGFLVMERGEVTFQEAQGHMAAYKARGRALAQARWGAARVNGTGKEMPPPGPGADDAVRNAARNAYRNAGAAPPHCSSQLTDRTATESRDRTLQQQQQRQGEQPRPMCSPAGESHVVVRGFSPPAAVPAESPGRWSSAAQLVAGFSPSIGTPRGNYELALLEWRMPFGHRKGVRVQDLSREDARFYAPMAKGAGLRRALELRVEQWDAERVK